MKTKFITLFALVLCMGAFFLPTTAFAAENTDTTPPTVKASITGDVLRIEAADTGTGVEAVYINDIRFNYRVDGAVEVAAKDYAGNGETISVYAVDFTGNKSDTVKITNPYYAAPAAIPTPTPTPTESAVPTTGAFTPDGTGTVVDNVTEQNGKEFFSITTADGNVFYLIIDRERASENVYLLNAVTEDDLMALAEKSDNKGSSAIPSTPTTPTTPTPDPTPTEPVEQPKTDSGGNSGMMIFIVLAVAAAGGAGYYFKIVRPKQQAAADVDEEFEEDEEMEFEDEAPDSDGDEDGETEDES